MNNDDYFDMAGFRAEEDEEDHRQGSSEVNNVGMGRQKSDTSASQARKGKDIQGITWETMLLTRDEYRANRLKQYKNYVSFPYSAEDLEKVCNQVKKDSTFYDFQFNTRLVQPVVSHFQLRNLVWATTKHDVYLVHNYSVTHWSSLLQRGKEILNVSGDVVPSLKPLGCQSQPMAKIHISTMTMKENLMAAGGFKGELLCKRLNTHDVSFCSKITDDENSITNLVDIYRNSNGSTCLISANNDCCVRILNTEDFTLLHQFAFPWAVNTATVSPDGKLIAVLGDSVDGLLVDANTGKSIGNLKGHLDFSFSSAWHPNGQILATGNQDTTCRLWDVRNLSESFAAVKGTLAAIRAIKFTSDGKYMAMAEAADFIHIFDTHSNYSKSQEIDLFGEIAGISFSPDGVALFVGISDRTYGSLMEFHHRRNYRYLDYYN